MVTKYKEIINKFNYQIVELQAERVREILDLIAYEVAVFNWRISSIEDMEFAIDKKGSIEAKITCVFKLPPNSEYKNYIGGTIWLHSDPGCPPIWDEIVNHDIPEDYDE